MIREKILQWLRKGANPVSPTNSHFRRIFGWDTEDKKITKPYEQIATVYACNRVIARNVAQVPFVIKQGDNPVTTGPIIALFNNVNDTMSRYQLWEAIVTQLGLWGEAFVVKDAEVVRGIPVALWIRSPADFKPAMRNGVWVGWEHFRDGVKEFLDKSQVIQPKYWNPYNQLRGMAPIDALMLSLQADWDAIRYNSKFFSQGGHVGEIFTTDERLNDQQYQRLEDQLINRRAGMESAHKGMVLDAGLKVQDLRKANKDMQFIELRKFTREEIAMVYGVPETELSLYKEIPYSNAVTADLGFWKKTLIPIMRLIEDKFNTDFLSELGYRGEFDVSQVDVLNAEVLEKADAAKTFYQIGIPTNQINARLGLGFEEIPNGDEPFAGRPAPAPAGLAVAEHEEKQLDIAGEPEMRRISDDQVRKEIRAAVWKRLDRKASPLVSACAREVKRYFHDTEQKLLRKIIKGKGDDAVLKAEVPPDVERAVHESIDDQVLIAIVSKYTGDAIELGWATIQTSAKLSDDVARALILERTQTMRGINETLRETLLRKLSQSIAEGGTEREQAQLVIDAVRDAFDIAKGRAQTIARTEVHSAFAKGRRLSADSTHPKAKMWLSSRDRRVRPSHVDMDGETVAWAKNYSNGLIHPLDWGGDPAEVINCRCVEVPIYEGEDESAMLDEWRRSTPEEFLRRREGE